MPRYQVSFERSAVQIRRVLLDAKDEKAAVTAATAYNKGHAVAIVHVSEDLYPDDESAWCHLDTEPSLR